jgi:SAM-dependent methyltransferase
MQAKQSEWHKQWTMFRDDERFLFTEWIAPVTLEDFRGKSVLEAGCGGGQHTSFIAPFASSVTAVDLNTCDLARERTAGLGNITFVEADIATMDLGRQFDVVMCIGVIHHTDDPDRTFENLYRHCRPGGRMVIWTYSSEGNGMVRYLVEPLRKAFLRRLPRKAVSAVSAVVTTLLYPPVFTIYKIPFLRFLPYYEYFGNFRRLSFRRNVLNVFDKLNAPQVKFTTLAKCAEWFSADRFDPESISVRKYAGVSYSLSGVRKRGTDARAAS